MVLLRQEAIAHQVLQHASDAFGVLTRVFLHSTVSDAAIHMGSHHGLHCCLVQLGKALTKPHAQCLVHLIGYPADHGQYQLHPFRLQRLFQSWRTPVLRTPAPSNLVHIRTRLVAITHEQEHQLQPLLRHSITPPCDSSIRSRPDKTKNLSTKTKCSHRVVDLKLGQRTAN